MKQLSPRASLVLVAILLVLGLAGPADAAGPGKKDPEKLAKALDKAVAQKDWDTAAATAEQGLATVKRGSEWELKYGEDFGLDARVLWERTLREAALASGELGRKQKSREIQRGALALVDLYLERWPEHSNSYEVRFQQADLAFLVKEFRKAADAYKAVYEMNANGSRRHHASAGWICAVWVDGADNWEYFDGLADDVHQDRKEFTDEIVRHQPIEIHDEERELVAALDAFIAAVPGHNETPPMLYRTAWLYWDRHQPREGVNRCIALLQGYSDSDEAPYAARMLIDLARWSEQEEEFQLRALALGLAWDEIEKLAARASGALPIPDEPDRISLFPRD
jgi:tetratricopeptide (TPR) repeat protein